MKRSLFVVALVCTAGTAVAQTGTTPPVYAPSPRANAVTSSTPAAPAANSQLPATQSPTAAGRTQMGAAGMTTANPPNAPAGNSMAAPSTANAPAMPNAPGSANALKKIQADGYKNVSGLTRNRDGSWSGKAMRGGSMVDVKVDARGNVTTP